MTRLRGWTLLWALFLTSEPLTAKGIRRLSTDGEQLSPIHTAMGISTVLQFTSRPSAVIVGDQDAFKVEYVGTSLTIKPTVPKSVTNLIVFLDYDRFNFTLSVGKRADADYIVVVERKRSKQAPPFVLSPMAQDSKAIPAKLLTRNIHRLAKNATTSLELVSVAFPPSRKSLIMRLVVSLLKPQVTPSFPINRDTLLLTQGGREIGIESFGADHMSLNSMDRQARLTLVIRHKRLIPGRPLEIMLLTSPHPLHLSLLL